MFKKFGILFFVLFLTVYTLVSAAPLTFQQVTKDSQEMRKNITWLTEGLLGLSKDSKLALSKSQKQKILPFFQALVQQKIVILQRNPNQQHRQNNNNNNNNFRSQGTPDINDPQVQARLNKLQENTVFGNQQADAIDAVLTGAQRTFIDNLNFNPDQYGFLDLGKLFGGNGERQGQRPDLATLQKLRKKMQAGQEQLMKLNNKALKMLQE